ncbi:MAG: GrpB family protein [Planctomycetota bacterium]|nr:GrpB family protein [Planctomycetota bacterium]
MTDIHLVESIAGLEPGQVTLVAHDPAWKDLAMAELKRIHAACPERIIERAHIGSTSVEGLLARPVLDLLIGVQEMMHSGDTIQPLKGIGYRCHGEQGVPGRRLFTLARENRSLVHVHLYRVGSPLWESAIGFRDRLASDSDLAQAYDQLRSSLLETDPGDLGGYEQAKRTFEAEAMGAE